MAAAIPFVALAVAVAGTALSYAGVRASASAQKRQAQQQAAMSERQAAIYEQQAQQEEVSQSESIQAAADVRRAAAQKAEDTAKQHRQLLAMQRARYGAAGVSMEGSPLLVQMESLNESENELLRITQAGETEARGYETQGTLYGMRAATARQTGAGYLEEAGYHRSEASAAGTAGTIQGISTLLSGAGQVYQFGKSKPLNWWS